MTVMHSDRWFYLPAVESKQAGNPFRISLSASGSQQIKTC
jgi:hypothetical protein